MVDHGRPWSATIDHGWELGRAFFVVFLATMVAWYLFTHGSSRDKKKSMHAAMTEAMHGHAYQDIEVHGRPRVLRIDALLDP